MKLTTYGTAHIALLLLCITMLSSCANTSKNPLYGTWIHSGTWNDGQTFNSTTVFHEDGVVEHIGVKNTFNGKEYKDNYEKATWQLISEQNNNIVILITTNKKEVRRTLELLDENTFMYTDAHGDGRKYIRQGSN